MSENNILNRQYTRVEMAEMIRRMRAANSTFYGLAVSTGVHAFIEFCGLQAKYIDLCNALLDSGIEFPMVNVHNDKRVDVAHHHIDYLAEKFECIYGPVFAGNPELVRYFIERVFGKKYLRESDHVE